MTASNPRSWRRTGAGYTLKTDRMRRLCTFILFLAVAIASSAAPQSAAPTKHPAAQPAKVVSTPKPDAALLPDSFAGWEAASPGKPVTDLAQADSSNAAALKEYGLTDALLNDYTRNGDTLKLK